MRLVWSMLCGAACVAVLALGDALTDLRVSLALFHVLPIAVVTWFAGRRAGLLLAGFAMLASLVVDLHVGVFTVDGPVVFTWATVNRLVAYVSAVVLLERLRDSQTRLAQLAQTDELTGLLNRRAFRERCEAELRRCRRQSLPMTLAMLDLNGFKAVNDSLGHATGDAVLRRFGQLLQQLRSGEVAARLGGDEFAVLFPNTSAPQALAALDRVLSDFETHANLEHWRVSCSAGLASRRSGDTSCDTVLHRADAAMYRQKQARGAPVEIS